VCFRRLLQCRKVSFWVIQGGASAFWDQTGIPMRFVGFFCCSGVLSDQSRQLFGYGRNAMVPGNLLRFVFDSDRIFQLSSA
jgi:hypothetical protein